MTFERRTTMMMKRAQYDTGMTMTMIENTAAQYDSLGWAYDMTHSARANLFQGSHSYLSTLMPEKSNHDHHDHCGGYYSWHLIVKIRPRIGTCLLRSMITLMSEVFEQSLKASLWLSLLIILYLQLGRLNPFFLFNSHCKACLANWRWILFLCNLLCGGRGIYSWRWCHHFAQPGSILLMLLAEYSNSNVAQSLSLSCCCFLPNIMLVLLAKYGTTSNSNVAQSLSLMNAPFCRTQTDNINYLCSQLSLHFPTPSKYELWGGYFAKKVAQIFYSFKKKTTFSE